MVSGEKTHSTCFSRLPPKKGSSCTRTASTPERAWIRVRGEKHCGAAAERSGCVEPSGLYLGTTYVMRGRCAVRTEIASSVSDAGLLHLPGFGPKCSLVFRVFFFLEGCLATTYEKTSQMWTTLHRTKGTNSLLGM